jgi:hypothetical protein
MAPKKCTLMFLEKKVKPWIEKVTVGKLYIFQRDGAPTHYSHLVQNWLDDNIDLFWSKDFWSSNSYNLNPLDHYVWSKDIEGLETHHQNVNH